MYTTYTIFIYFFFIYFIPSTNRVLMSLRVWKKKTHTDKVFRMRPGTLPRQRQRDGRENLYTVLSEMIDNHAKCITLYITRYV